MLFIVYTEQDLKSFITYDLSGGGSTVIHENIVVHPLFWHLRNVVQAIDAIPVEKLEDVTPKRFYQEYLTSSLPMVVKDGAAEWAALEKWKDLDYFSEEFGNKTVRVIRAERENVWASGVMGSKTDIMSMMSTSTSTMTAFVNRTRTAKSLNWDTTFYVQNELITSRTLVNDFVRPKFIQSILRPR
jgi:hypothetical protein